MAWNPSWKQKTNQSPNAGGWNPSWKQKTNQSPNAGGWNPSWKKQSTATATTTQSLPSETSNISESENSSIDPTKRKRYIELYNAPALTDEQKQEAKEAVKELRGSWLEGVKRNFTQIAPTKEQQEREALADMLEAKYKKGVAFGAGVIGDLPYTKTLAQKAKEIYDPEGNYGEKNMLETAKEANKGAYLAGNVLSQLGQYAVAGAALPLIPGVGTVLTKGGQAVNTLTKGKIGAQAATNILAGQTLDTAIQTPRVISEGISEGKSGGEIAKDVLKDQAINFALNTTFEGVGTLAKGAIKKLKAGKEITSAEAEAVKKEIKETIFYTDPYGNITTTPKNSVLLLGPGSDILNSANKAEPSADFFADPYRNITGDIKDTRLLLNPGNKDIRILAWQSQDVRDMIRAAKRTEVERPAGAYPGEFPSKVLEEIKKARPQQATPFEAISTPNMSGILERPFAAYPGEMANTVKDIPTQLKANTTQHADIPTVLKEAAPSKIPTDIPRSLKQSEFRTNTLEKSQPKEALKNLDPKEFDYIPESSKKWENTALKNIEQNRAKVIEDIEKAESINGGTQAHEAAILSHDLLLEAQKTGDYSAYRNFLKTVASKTRETARALKATDTAWDKTTSDGAILQAQRVVDKIESNIKDTNPNLIKKIDAETDTRIKELSNLGENPDPQVIRDIVKKQYKVPVLEDADIKFIADKMSEANKEIEGSYAQRMLRAQVLNLIANKIPATGVEKIQATQRIMMLLNPKTTLVRNPLGNVMLGALENVKNIPATALDKAISLKTGKRTTLISPLVKGKAELGGMEQGLKEWKLDIKNKVSTSPTGGQADIPLKTTIFSENHNIKNTSVKKMFDKAGKMGNETHQVVSRMLQLGDRPFYQGAYNSRLEELKLLNKTGKITDEMKMQAREHALERTFQNDSWIAQKMLRLGAKKTDPAIWRVLVHLIMPFKQTPANILDKFIDYSGVGGIAKALGHAAQTKGKGTFNQKYFVDTMARGLTGGGLVALGYLMAQKGLVTGGYNSTKKVENFETALGKGNYAFKIGDTYQTFDWALPASAPIAIGSAFHEAQKGSNENQNATMKGLEAAVNLLFESTVLQGPSSLLSGYSPAAGIGNALLNTTTQITPTGGKQIAQLIDPYVRETYDPNKGKEILNKTVARIPLLSKTLPIKQNVLGEDVEAFQGKNNIYNVMINPGFATTYKPTATQKEIETLYEITKDTEVLPREAPKFLADPREKDKNIYLTAEERAQYQKTLGQTSFDILNNMIGNSANLKDTYTQEEAEARVKQINDVYEYAVKRAKAQFFAGRGIQY